MLEISSAQSNEVLKFGNTVGDYIRFKPNMQPFSEEFSLCSWIRKLSTSSGSSWFSYATRSNDNEIVISDEGSDSRMFRSYTANVRVQAGVTAGVWYHYCLCWSLSSRTATIHHNSRQTGSYTTPSGRRVPADGYLVLGQDQDSYGGGFSLLDVFGGELHKTNIFSKKLSSSEVSELYSAGRCSDAERKYDDVRQLKWEQILQQPRTGNVRAEMGTCQVELLEEQLADIRKELTDTKTNKEEISDQLEEVRANLEQTTGQLTEKETKLNQTEKQMEKVEANLAVTVSQLNQTEKNLEKTRIHLNETLSNVEELEEEIKEIKKSISGNDCFRLPNSSRWDVLYTSSFFGNVVTEEMLQILDESWQKLGRFLYQDLSGSS